MTHLTLGRMFNQRLENLPNSLTHLELGKCFNQKLKNLPKHCFIFISSNNKHIKPNNVNIFENTKENIQFVNNLINERQIESNKLFLKHFHNMTNTSIPLLTMLNEFTMIL